MRQGAADIENVGGMLEGVNHGEMDKRTVG
jgi:hypothetical protein